jgi:hypothetical protein
MFFNNALSFYELGVLPITKKGYLMDFFSIAFNGLQNTISVSHFNNFFIDILSLYELGVLPITKKDN